MNLNKIIFLLISIGLLSSCADYKTDRMIKKKEKLYYSSIGFALIYDDNIYPHKDRPKIVPYPAVGVFY